MYLYLHLCRCHVINLFYLYFPFFHSFQYRLLQCVGRLAKRNLPDDERLVVEFLYLCPDLEYSPALSVVVAAYVNGTASGEVGIELERLATQVADGSIAQLAEVVWQHF